MRGVELDTVPKRMRWILANRSDPRTGKAWKGNALGRAAELRSIAHINMIARGEIAEPSTELLNAVARVAPVSAVWLITGRGTPGDDDAARAPSTSESATPHMANAIGFDDALAEAKRRDAARPEASRVRPHAWEAVGRAGRYEIRGRVTAEDILKLARVYEELADPARLAAAFDDQARRIAELEAELEAERAARPKSAAKRARKPKG